MAHACAYIIYLFLCLCLYVHRYIFSCGEEWLLSQDSQRIQWSEKVEYCTIGIDTVK